MSLLGSVGTLVYNGIDLNPAETLTTGFNLKPVMDAAKRTVVYVETLLSIHSVIYATNADNVAAAVDAYKIALMTPAAPLIYTAKGGGTLQANVPGEPQRDVCYGPLPQYFRLSNIHQNAIHFDWAVLVCLPGTCSQPFYSGLPMEVNFALNFTIDQSGWSKRTYRGHLIIPTTRATPGATAILDNADAYRPQIVPAPLVGFRRTTDDFGLNEAKTRLDFTVIDEEMADNIPPPGVILVTASDDRTTVQPGNFNQYSGTLTAEYELQKGSLSSDAFMSFLNIWNDRKFALSQYIMSVNNDGKPPCILPIGFSCSEPDIYGKPRCRFTLKYSTSMNVRRFLTAGLWRPVPDSNWQQWSASVAVFNADGRGLAGLQFQNNQDAIIDLCAGTSTLAPMTAITLPNTSPSNNDLTGTVPAPENSWMHYRNAVYLETRDSTIVQKPLSMSQLNVILQPDGAGDFSGSGNTQGDWEEEQEFDSEGGYEPALAPPTTQTPPTIIQQRSASTYYVVMIGEAVRANFQISPPDLVSVGGVQAIPANKKGYGFIQGQIGGTNVPIFAGSWKLRYLIAGPPPTVGVPPNPNFSDDTLPPSAPSAPPRGSTGPTDGNPTPATDMFLQSPG